MRLLSETTDGGGVAPWDNPATLSPAEVLRRARPLPPIEDTLIEGLTDEQEQVFWETITAA